MSYDEDYERVVEALRNAIPSLKQVPTDDAKFEAAWDAVIEESADFFEADWETGEPSEKAQLLLDVFGGDPGEASWDAQRARINVAEALGYKAVEMSDEHDVSYGIVPGVKALPEDTEIKTLYQSAKNEREDILKSAGFRQWFGDKSIDALEADYAALTDDKGRKLTDDGHHIDTDLVRELAPAYRADRSLSGQLHPYASALTKELFKRALARKPAPNRYQSVLFLGGGGGSGKSTVLGSAGSEHDITFDGTLSNFENAKRDIDAVLASGRDVAVFFVYSEPLKAYNQAVSRANKPNARVVPNWALAEAHANAPGVVKRLAAFYSGDARVQFAARDNSYGRGEHRSIAVDSIPEAYDAAALAEKFNQASDAKLAAGEIDAKLHAAITAPKTADGLGGKIGQTVQGKRSGEYQHPLTLNQSPVEELPHVDRNEAERIFRSALEAELANGRLSEKLYAAFNGSGLDVAGGVAREGNREAPQTRPQQHARNPLTSQQSPAESGASSLQAKIADGAPTQGWLDGEPYSPPTERLSDQEVKRVLDTFNAHTGGQKADHVWQVQESHDIGAKSRAFQALAEQEGWHIAPGTEGDKYFLIGNQPYRGRWGDALTIPVRVSDHSNVNRGRHFKESAINLAPDDGHAFDSFESALWKLRNASADEYGDLLIGGEEAVLFQGQVNADAIAAERAATERAYGGRAAYDQAKADGRTKLTYHQWIEVRTPRFKQWFGDWEAVRGVELLESAQPLPLDDVPPLADKKAVENAFRSFDMPANRHDGRKVRFPVSTAGKVVRHKGFDIASVAGAFDRLFESAVPMMSQVEQAREGHKDHTRNIEGYHHYVNRFTRDGKTYYVRFTVQQMLGSRKQAGESLLHSAFVSSVEIYEQNKGAAPETVSVWESPVLTAGATPYDSILSQWLEAGKQGASKVIDPETGEPLVVYHGGRSTFSAIKRGFGNFLGGLFVREGKPSGYGEKQFELFLRGEVLELDVLSDLLETEEGQKVLSEMLPNDVDEDVLSEVAEALTDGSHYPDSEVVWDAIGAIDEADSAVEIQVLRGRLAQAFGYPSVRTPDEFDGDTIMVMEPAAIKSATDNNGNYSADADSTLEQQKGDKPRGQIRFLPERTFSIDLFEGADGSTFMHEAAHFVLEQMQDLAEQSEAVKAELDRVRAWLGNDGGQFTADEHERFARGFELYLREGKAPVPGLRRLFERMKNWLMQAYKHALELNVTLNDDIRGVFDRLLASEAEIEAAKRKQGDSLLALSEEARGMLKAGQYEKYVEAREAALAEAREALLAKLNAAERRKHEQWWKKELKALVAQKLAEIDASPAGRAQQRMRADKSLRLDKAALVARYGKAWTQDSLRALGVYTVKGGKSASSPAVLAATMERGAQTLDEARKHAKTFVGQPLTNQSTGLEARVSNTNLGKMTSEKAGKKSSTAADHALAVANVDKLFRNALLDHSHADSKGEPTIAAIHRYVAPMVTHDGRVVAVKMTVKETTGPKEPNPVYSIETLDIQNPPSVLSRVNPDGTGIHPQAGFNANVLQRMDEVKDALQAAIAQGFAQGIAVQVWGLLLGQWRELAAAPAAHSLAAAFHQWRSPQSGTGSRAPCAPVKAASRQAPPLRLPCPVWR